MRISLAAALALVAAALPVAAPATAADGVIRVGSKSFTESYILAEIIAQVIEQVGEARAERRVGLGGTGLTQRALESGAIDVYPEYTGTLALVILKDPALQTIEALRAAPDTALILMDVMMPGMDGYATMTAVRQMPQFGRLPIIAVTARAMPGDREKSLAAGANDYVTKPVDTDELLACMERVELRDHAVWFPRPERPGT